jgi:hypothetical protein
MSLSKNSSSKKRTIESERRVFQEKWEIAYFCCEIEGRITCLICGQNIVVGFLSSKLTVYEVRQM